MKVILTIFCALVIIFAGGCLAAAPYMTSQAWWLLWSAIGLNVAVILGTWTVKWYLQPALYLLGTVDVVIALLFGIESTRAFGGPSANFWMLPAAAAAFFAVKAALTFRYARQCPAE